MASMTPELMQAVLGQVLLDVEWDTRNVYGREQYFAVLASVFLTRLVKQSSHTRRASTVNDNLIHAQKIIHLHMFRIASMCGVVVINH